MSNIENQFRDLLDSQAQSIDGASLSRLRQARARAAEAAQHSSSRNMGYWLGAGSGLVALSLAAVLFVRTPHDSIGAPPLPVSQLDIDSLELATQEVELDLMEDLEFYQWLESGGAS